MQKIIEKILEPSKIRTGSSFLLKVKAIRYATYGEVKTRKVLDLKKFTVGQMRGE